MNSYNSTASSSIQLIKQNAIKYGEYIENLRSFKDGVRHTQKIAKEVESKTVEIEQKLGNMINPLMEEKSEIEKMNKLITLTNRFSYLFKLPTTM